jgi:hypothetical protein
MEILPPPELTIGMSSDKKAKYELRFGTYLSYFFVTTTRTEADCINILTEMAHNRPSKESKAFRIIKIKNGESKVIAKGTVKGIGY